MTNEELYPGDTALIIGPAWRPDLIGRECNVLDVLLDNRAEHAYAGHSFTGYNDNSLSAFIEIDGEILFFGTNRLFKLKDAEVQPKELEVVA
ncbi:hypothetical protein [Leptolyngbya phage Lbo-JY16]